MNRELRANLWLIALTILICALLYPGILLALGQILLHERAEGSLVRDARGNVIGSRLIAQPFTEDRYFRPRPSAASYNASASAGTNWGSNNHLLRDRVCRILGPIVKYSSGPKMGEPVGPDIEQWFQRDRYLGRPGIVGQWAESHPNLAANWVKADPLNAAFVAAWHQSHPQMVANWLKENPGIPEPKPDDLAVLFFTSFSAEHPGTFPSAVEQPSADGPVRRVVAPVSAGSDIQSIFFDMWRREHADAEIAPVPADMVMASGSGLDPHITLKNALYQLDRVAAAWAAQTGRDPAAARGEIVELLKAKTEAPLQGLVGVEIVNVLKVNLALRDHFGARSDAGK